MGKTQESTPPHRDIIVLGASAGGVQALCEVIGRLPPNLPAAVFVVLHIAPHSQSAMPAILSRAGCMPASHPEDGEPIVPGWIYVAPPDRHLAMEDSKVCLLRNAAENGHRPAVDVLFRSAAREYGRRVIAVVMTGNLDDGTAGLALVKRLGGVAVVQDPEDADYPGMPESAITHVEVDYVVPVANIGSLLDRLVHEPLPDLAEELAPGEPSRQADRRARGRALGRDARLNDGGISERYHQRAEDAEKHARFLRTLLQQGGADLE
ncbi:MAG TPA: chemotaxis protein CheB [Thermoanaerobaculia bacterium]|nr:chemotaxis protein CheB [Thermoanaerobaculia bacterium]